MNRDSIASALSHYVSVRIQVAVVVLAGMIAYAGSFRVPLQFDDITTLGSAYTNAAGGGLGLFSPGASRWVADITFAVNRYVHGFQVGGYHLVNLGIHLGASVTVLALLRALLESYPVDQAASQHSRQFLKAFVPLASALLFVSHPIQTEAVTYISQRYTSLSALFYLFSLYSYLQARRPMKTTSVLRQGAWWAAFVVAAVMAMKCKQTSVTLPLVAVLLELVTFRGGLLKKPAFIVLLVALFLVVPIQEISSRNAGSTGSIAQALQQASSETTSISRYSYFLTQQRVEVTYLRLLLYPAGQNLDYDYPVFSSVKSWPVIGSLLLHAFLAALAVVLLLRSNREAGECNSLAMRLAGIGIIWFYLTLSVESSVIPIRDVIFEHRLYLPSVGFFMAATAGAGWLAARRGWMRRGAWALLALLAVVLTVATVNRNRVWNSELVMWMDVIAKSPDKARARANAGLYFAKRMVNDRAVLNFVRAIELDPLNDKNRIYLNQLVTGLEGYDKRAADGMRYQSGLDVVDPGKIVPWRALSFNNTGLAYEFLNQPAQAMQNYLRAVELDPGLDLAWYNLSLLAGRQNDVARCGQAAERLAALNRVLWETLRQQNICGPR